MSKLKKLAIIVLISIIFISSFSSTLLALQGGELQGNIINFRELDEAEGEYEVEAEGEVFFQYEEWEITGNKAWYNSLEGILNFEGEVELSTPELFASGSKLIYDQSQSLFTINGDRARISYQDFEAEAEEIEYFEGEEELILKGSVSGRRGNQEFSARKITVDLSGERIELSGDARFRFPREED